MKNLNETTIRAAAAVFALALSLQGRAYAAEDLSSYFEGSNRGSLAEMVRGMRSDKGLFPAPKAPAAEPGQNPQPGNNELLHFWEDLKSDVFDDICKGVEIPLDQSVDLAQVGVVKGEFKRYMKQFPDNKIAVIDEVGVKLNAAHTFSDVLNIGGSAFNIGFGGALEGKSVVVRKTNEDKYCKNLLNLVDLRKVKTILPINEKRIREMGVNEIWKFPAVLRMNVSGGAGYPVQPWLTVSFSLGSSKELKPSVTLFRMSEDKLRFRIRLDRINVKSAGASAGTSFDAGMIGLPAAENFLVKEIDKNLVKEFNKYIAFRFGLSTSRAQGKKILLEFIIDPRDPEQVARLVDFLKGDLGIIKKLIQMGIQFNDYSSSDDNAAGAQALQNVDNVAQQGLGLNSTFAGANHFNSTSHAMNIVLPVVLDRETSTTQRYDRYQAAGADQVLHVNTVAKNESVSNINVPFIGKIFKHNTSQNFYVVNYEDKAGAVSDAAVVYQRYEGYIKHDERDARGMVKDMNEILKYAGTHGDGTNGDFVVDVDALFPRLTAEEQNPSCTGADNDPVPCTKSYKSAIMSFSLVFTQKAVRDIVNAQSSLIMKAVLNVMEGLDREIVSKIYDLFRIDAEGKVKYDWKTASKRLEQYKQDGENAFDPLSTVNSFCANVAHIVSDIASVRDTADQKDKSKRLSEVLAGKGKSRLGYESLLQVVIQLVDVKDIFAKLDIKTDKRIKGEENVNSAYNLYNSGLQDGYNQQLNAANSLRDRFSDPTELSD